MCLNYFAARLFTGGQDAVQEQRVYSQTWIQIPVLLGPWAAYLPFWAIFPISIVGIIKIPTA